jgi:hypothetical protein
MENRPCRCANRDMQWHGYWGHGNNVRCGPCPALTSGGQVTGIQPDYTVTDVHKASLYTVHNARTGKCLVPLRAQCPGFTKASACNREVIFNRSQTRMGAEML